MGAKKQSNNHKSTTKKQDGTGTMRISINQLLSAVAIVVTVLGGVIWFTMSTQGSLSAHDTRIVGMANDIAEIKEIGKRLEAKVNDIDRRTVHIEDALTPKYDIKSQLGK